MCHVAKTACEGHVRKLFASDVQGAAVPKRVHRANDEAYKLKTEQRELTSGKVWREEMEGGGNGGKEALNAWHPDKEVA